MSANADEQYTVTFQVKSKNEEINHYLIANSYQSHYEDGSTNNYASMECLISGKETNKKLSSKVIFSGYRYSGVIKGDLLTFKIEEVRVQPADEAISKLDQNDCKTIIPSVAVYYDEVKYPLNSNELKQYKLKNNKTMLLQVKKI